MFQYLFSKPIINIPFSPHSMFHFSQAIIFENKYRDPPSLELLSFEKGGIFRCEEVLAVLTRFTVSSPGSVKRTYLSIVIYHILAAISRIETAENRRPLGVTSWLYIYIYVRGNYGKGLECLETNYRHLEPRFNVSGSATADDDNRHMSFPWLAKTKIPNGASESC